MELEKLTRSQIVLLTLLTSFVSSIATGIVTVSLMEQAPPAIAQTVNRVVERTVEKVVPSSQPAAAATVVQETVVVREADLLAAAIDSVSPSIVRIYTTGKDESGKEVDVFVGLAVVAGTDGSLISDSGITDTGNLIAVRSDEKRVPVALRSKDRDTGISRLHAATTSGADMLEWKPATFATGSVRLGDTIVAIAGRTSPRLSQGIVTALGDEKKETGQRIVETNIPTDAYVVGSPLVSLNGEVVGLATAQSRTGSVGGFLASSAIILHNTPADNQEGSKAAAN